MEPFRSFIFNNKALFSVFFLIVFSTLNIGGCSNNNGGGSDPDLVVIGEHRDVALSGISQVIPIDPHDGEPTNILLDGIMLSDLSDDEIDLIRESYEAGFTIVFYEVSERDIIDIYSRIIDHPITHAEIENLENIIEGSMSPIFTIEKHGNVDWTSTGDINVGNPSEDLLATMDGMPDDDPPPLFEPEDEFVAHGRLIREWLIQHPDRKQQIIDQNLVSMNAEELIDDLGLRDELDEQLGVSTRTESGTLLDLANANIHTSVKTVSFSETPNKNTYAMTSKAWIITADTPTGVFTFLLVRQDFNLASSNGFTYDEEGDRALTGKYFPAQFWYLKEYGVKNTYQVGSKVLTINEAQLLEESPATNQETSQTSTTSLTASISGRVAADTGTSGATANVAVQGGVSWGTSTTVSKADVSINNLSLTDNAVVNDARWQFLPRQPEAGGQRGSCKNFGLRNLADLAHTTFQPATAFIVRINNSYVGQTLKIVSTFTIQTEGSRIQKCGPFGCNCGVHRETGLGPWITSTSHSLRIPYPPEGPAGDATCSDGIDNDNDSAIDANDPSCQ